MVSPAYAPVLAQDRKGDCDVKERGKEVRAEGLGGAELVRRRDGESHFRAI